MIRTMIRAQLWFEASCHGAGHALDLLLRSLILFPRMGKRWKETLQSESYLPQQLEKYLKYFF